MAIRILHDQGPLGIKQKMASLTEKHDEWYLFTIDTSACAKYLPSEKVIHAIDENLQTYDGVATAQGDSVIVLLHLAREVEIFNNLMVRLLPDGFCFIKMSGGLTEHNIHQSAWSYRNKTSLPHDEVPLSQRSPAFRDRHQRHENRAMIIDDDAYIRTVFSATLKHQFKTTEMANGNDIQNFYKDILPDIVFVDIHLPEMNGFEILEKIMDIDPDAYVIVISGDSIQSNVMQAIKMGAKGFLTKPPKRSTLDDYLIKCPTAKLDTMAHV